MSDAYDALDRALGDARGALKKTKANRGVQVRNDDERAYLKAVALTWFHSHRPLIDGIVDLDLAAIDAAYKAVLEATSKGAARTTYTRNLKIAYETLNTNRSHAVIRPKKIAVAVVPDFTSLAKDAEMRRILERRWAECERCLHADAPLAATVMMGGLLEALFVARANKLADKAGLFSASSAPVDRETGKKLPLQKWVLKAYIDVAHELGWITTPAKGVAEVLRDYRNFIHPAKERSHGVEIGRHDAQMFWSVTGTIVAQLLALPT